MTPTHTEGFPCPDLLPYPLLSPTPFPGADGVHKEQEAQHREKGSPCWAWASSALLSLCFVFFSSTCFGACQQPGP